MENARDEALLFLDATFLRFSDDGVSLTAASSFERVFDNDTVSGAFTDGSSKEFTVAVASFEDAATDVSVAGMNNRGNSPLHSTPSEWHCKINNL